KFPMQMKRFTLLTLLMLLVLSAGAQTHTLTFTSITDAKFFVYVNGKLQNQKSSGMVTVGGLEEKKYHIRIVIDDPFEVAVTSTIKPDGKHNEYTVQFNAVRERVYLKPAKEQTERRIWQDDEEAEAEAAAPAPASSEQTPRQRTTVRRQRFQDTATQRIVNHVRTQTISD
ncbi:MAG: hypothetical protein IKN84_07720, partial [Bacteroidales bacterium]|nr:hypothetical protein [Bacteroidales bacterium]